MTLQTVKIDYAAYDIWPEIETIYNLFHVDRHERIVRSVGGGSEK